MYNFLLSNFIYLFAKTRRVTYILCLGTDIKPIAWFFLRKRVVGCMGHQASRKGIKNVVDLALDGEHVQNTNG